MAQLEWVGKHSIGLEDDMILLRCDGFMTVAEITELHTIADRLMAGRGDLYVLSDGTNAGNSEPETRKLIVEWFQSHSFSAAASYGGSMIHRAISALIVNAVRIVNKKIIPMSFFKTEAEARRWLDTLRQAKRTSAPHKSP